jgi:SAM-dependent methyltransferase
VKGNPFADLTYESMKVRALDPNLAPCEKVGFPRHYREGREELIFADILSKLTNLNEKGKVFLEIGPGCSELAMGTLAFCREKEHQVTLFDSAEMLSQLPDYSGVDKLSGMLPHDSKKLEALIGKVDALLMYSVFQMIEEQGGAEAVLQLCLDLLAPGGRLLIGDLPNQDKRRRFFSSPRGIEYHRQYRGDDSLPPAELVAETGDGIGDKYVFKLLTKVRGLGYEAFILPQMDCLPFSNRREDILIVRP